MKESAPDLHEPVQTLRVTPLHHSGCVAIYDVRCRPSDFARGPEEWSLTDQIVFPRRGVFVHETRGQTIVADANRALFFNRGETYRVAHPACSGDDCTVFAFEAALLAEAVSEREPARGAGQGSPFRFTHAPSDDSVFALHERLRHAALDAGGGELAIDEAAVQLLGALLGAAYRGRDPVPRRTRASTARAQHEQVERTSLFLATHLGEDLSLAAVARAVHSSPFHLARVFRREAGLSIHQYRHRLRLRQALVRIAEGELDLAALALTLGFASHSHLTDSFRRAFGAPPSAYRKSLSAARLRELSRILEAPGRPRL